MAKHHLHSPVKRALYSFALLVIVMGAGTLGMHVLEKMAYLDAFYFMAMIATSQGPMMIPVTTGGKLFAAFMAFVSVGTVVASIGFLFGPFMGRLWRIGVLKFEDELHRLKK